MVKFYPKEYPEPGDLVTCRIEEIHDDTGYTVELLEYDGITGFVGLKEITQAKWLRNLRGQASEGDIEVMEVISIGEKGEIDLSRRYISDSEKQETLSRYRKWKRVYDFLLHMASQEHSSWIVQHVIHPYLLDMQKRIPRSKKEDDDSGTDEHSNPDAHSDSEEKEIIKTDEVNDNRNIVQRIELSRSQSGRVTISQWISTTVTISSDHDIKSDIDDEVAEIERMLSHDDHQRKISSIHTILDHVVRLLEKPLERKIQSANVQLKALTNLRVGKVNHVLQRISQEKNITIRTYNTKTSTFQINSKEKMSAEEFTEFLHELLPFVDFCASEVAIQNEFLDKQELKSETKTIQGNQSEQSVQPLLNIGIVGHVAHGKTTLIEALSGVDTRKYKREIATNRTLNIGYTNATVYKCQCNGTPIYFGSMDERLSTCQCPSVTVSIVDCPGHNVLLSTMITGAQIMDTCILVVSAEETCPQLQTNEHVAVLQIIGEEKQHFSEGIIVQNKVDLTNMERAEQSHQEIKSFVEDTLFSSLPVIPVSAQMKINVQHILRFIYEYTINKVDIESKNTVETMEAVQQSEDKSETNEIIHSKGIIVRTFDINKPGSERVQGAVIGGSITHGTFSVGEEILILPMVVSARILSMKTEKIDLASARPGGLIAIQTDINPTYCSMLVGCTFIKSKDYEPSRLLSAGTPLRFKYSLLRNASMERLAKNDSIIINHSGGNVECNVLKSSSDKYRAVLSLSKPLYAFPGENVMFTMVHKKRLVGFGRSLDHPRISSGHKIDNGLSLLQTSFEEYDILLKEFQQRLKEWKETSMAKVRLPVPKTMYRNTFTTIVNFGIICDALNVSTDELGIYIFHELGCKSWSVNGLRQLILKGRTDERKVMSVLHHFIMEKRCLLCRRNTVKTIRNMGVKQRICTNCSWKG